MKTTADAVLFDLDGTLIDTAPDFVTVLNAMRAEHSLQALAPEVIRARVSDGARAMVGLGFGVDETAPNFAELRQNFLDRYLNHLAVDTALFDGMEDVLLALESNGIPWGVVTNKPRLYAERVLEGLALDKRCAVLVCPDDVTKTKPDPEPLFLALKHISATPETSIYAGDHVRDIEAGNNAAMTTIACAWGYGADFADWNADAVANRPADIQHLAFNLSQ